MIVFSGTANKELAEKISKSLNIKLGKLTTSRFSDGEIGVKVHENVRGKDVFIIQPTCPPVNEMALCPRACNAMARSATDTCSPVESSISNSRSSGESLI